VSEVALHPSAFFNVSAFERSLSICHLSQDLRSHFFCSHQTFVNLGDRPPSATYHKNCDRTSPIQLQTFVNSGDRFPFVTYHKNCDRTSRINLVAMQTQTFVNLSDLPSVTYPRICDRTSSVPTKRF
jgi:hypothetical protein